MQFQEKKKGEKQKSEYFQTQWRKHVDKLTIPPKQTPVYLAVSKEPSKKKHRTGEGSLGARRLKKKRKKKENTIQYICLLKSSNLFISFIFIHTG